MAQIKLQADGLNLADTFAFTGTVTGAGGITETDLWILDTTVTGDHEPITDWARASVQGQDKMGTGLSESSGDFTFPSTGYWYVQWNGYFTRTSEDYSAYFSINTGADAQIARVYQGTHASHHSSFVVNALIDVADTAAQKVSFAMTDSGAVDDAGSCKLQGSASHNKTTLLFVRYGDT